MTGKIVIVRCPKCGNKVFKYLKVGRGRLLRCWKNRIISDYSIHNGEEIRCSRCGNLIGIDEGEYIKMKHHMFI